MSFTTPAPWISGNSGANSDGHTFLAPPGIEPRTFRTRVKDLITTVPCCSLVKSTKVSSYHRQSFELSEIQSCCVTTGADPGWSVRGGVEVKIATKGANFARFWSILEGAAPPCPPFWFRHWTSYILPSILYCLFFLQKPKCSLDPIHNASYLREIYLKANPGMSA